MGLGSFTIKNYGDGEPVKVRSTVVEPLSPDTEQEHVAHHVFEVAPVEHRLSGTGHATNDTSTAVSGMTPASDERAYVSAAQVANFGSSDVLVTLQDGSGGAALAYICCKAGDTVAVQYPSPLRTTVDTQLHFEVEDSVASPATTSVYVSAQGYSE